MSLSPLRLLVRKRKVSDSVISIVKKLTYDSNVAVDSMSSKAILMLVEIERHRELGPGANIDTLRPISRSCDLRTVALIAPILIKNPDTQYKRRLAAKSEIFNQISLAAVATAIQAPVEDSVSSLYIPENIHWIDAMSVLLFDKLTEGVRIDPSALSKLKKKSKSVSRTLNQPQNRVVKCYFDSSAAGLLL